jgi:uncharacterized alkaline shock family protein YloU
MTEVTFNAPGQPGYGEQSPQPTQVEPQRPDLTKVAPTPYAEDHEPGQVHSYEAEASGAPAPASATSGRVAVQVVDRLRNNADRGTTTVPTEVMEKVAVLAVREAPGVWGFEGAVREDGGRALALAIDGRAATVSIRLTVEYGFAVYPVTDKVRTKVIGALENLFGLEVTAVDIIVDDVHIAEAESGSESAAEG